MSGHADAQCPTPPSSHSVAQLCFLAERTTCLGLAFSDVGGRRFPCAKSDAESWISLLRVSCKGPEAGSHRGFVLDLKTCFSPKASEQAL